MAINITTDINVTTSGKLTDIGQIQGGWKTVDTVADMNALTGSATLKGKLQNGQLFYISSSAELYVVSQSGAGIFASYFFKEFNFPGSITTASVSNNDITFTKGDASTFTITVDTGSGGGGGGGGGDITAVTAGDGLSGGASSGAATLTLNTSSNHFISGAIDTAIFQKTGSFYATTNALEITGSLQLEKTTGGNALTINSGSSKRFAISSSGVLELATQSSTPAALAGGVYLDNSYNLYVGTN